MELLKIYRYFVLLAIYSYTCFSTDTNENAIYNLLEGDSLAFCCDSGIQFTEMIGGGRANYLFQQPANMDDRRKVFRNINHENETLYSKNDYKVSLISGDGNMANFLFNITNVKERDEGSWLCAAAKGTSEPAVYRTVTLNVERLQEVGKVTFTMQRVNTSSMRTTVSEDGENGPMAMMATEVVGDFEFNCNAEGGQPLPTYSIYKNGILISNQSKATLSLVVGDKSVSCEVGVKHEKFDPTNKCDSLVPISTEHIPARTLIYYLNVTKVPPRINCISQAVHAGYKKASLTCTVMSIDVTCSKVKWKSATAPDPGYLNTDSYDCSSAGTHSVKSSLIIPVVKQNHFDNDSFYIEVDTEGYGTYQHPVKLLKKPGALSGAEHVKSIGSLALVALVTAMTMIL